MMYDSQIAHNITIMFIPDGAKKCPELCVTIAVRRLYGEKFPFALLQTNMYFDLVINFSDVINDVTECRLMTRGELKIELCK